MSQWHCVGCCRTRRCAKVCKLKWIHENLWQDHCRTNKSAFHLTIMVQKDPFCAKTGIHVFCLVSFFCWICFSSFSGAESAEYQAHIPPKNRNRWVLLCPFSRISRKNYGICVPIFPLLNFTLNLKFVEWFWHGVVCSDRAGPTCRREPKVLTCGLSILWQFWMTKNHSSDVLMILTLIPGSHWIALFQVNFWCFSLPMGLIHP